MKKTKMLILTLTFALKAFGQIYDPQILVLTPNKFKYEKVFKSEIETKNIELANIPKNSELADFIKSEDFKKQPEIRQQITLSEIEFMEKLYFPKQISYITYQYLIYRLYERLPNWLIRLSEKKTNGSLTELMRIAETEKMQYVLNFSKIQLYKKEEISYSEISVQLYDNSTKKLLINSDYEGDWTNHGFEFCCKDKSIDCTLNNALSKALEGVINQVLSNSPTIKRNKELAQLRFDKLITNYYSETNEIDFLLNIIPQSDSNIVLTDQYQILIDSSKTKFVAFFLEQGLVQDFKTLKDNKRDNDVSILSCKDIKDEGFLEEIPRIFAYIVKGVKYNEKWYYKKSNVTYFETRDTEEGKQNYFYNLVKWNFFQENSTEFNPDFWETSLFEKVDSSAIKNKNQIKRIQTILEETTTPEKKEKYQRLLDDYYAEDLKNEKNIGMYVIVVDQMDQEKVKQDE